jgi:hypothetical protein
MPLPSGKTITLGGVQVSDEGVSEAYSLDASSATHRIKCLWADRYSLIPYLFNANGTGRPYAYPDAAWMFVDQVSVEGEGVLGDDSLSGRVSYEYANLSIVYRAINYASDGTETAALQMDLSTTAFSCGGSTPYVKWAAGASGSIAGKSISPEISPVLEVVTGTIIKSRANVSTLDTATIASLLNTVNNATFLGFAAETLRYKGNGTHRRFTVSGAEHWNSGHVWELISVGWNTLFSPITGLFEPFVVAATGSKFYTPASQTPLLST